MQRLRLGVVGCGSVSTTYHLPAIRECAEAQLTALVDVDALWVERLARDFRVPRWLTDYRKLVGLVDAVVIATPNAVHAEMSRYYLDHGIHVLCEKPFATTADEARRVFRTAQSTGARCMAAHCLRFAANVQLLKRLIDGHTFGAVRRIYAGLGTPRDRAASRTDFRASADLAGGGVLMDLGVHLIDLATWLAGGKVESVRSQLTGALRRGIDQGATVRLTFAEGAQACLDCSSTRGIDKRLRVEGTEGWATISLDGSGTFEMYSARAPVGRRDGVQRLALPESSIYVEQIRHFCRNIVSGAPFLITSSDVTAGLEVIDQCYQEWQPAVTA